MSLLQLPPQFEEDMRTLGHILTQKNWLCATAESCTGGLLGASMTSIAGASAWFAGGIMAYANAVKVAQLNVSAMTLLHEGAVSKACVEAMAVGLCQKFTVDVAISISGIAGPDGGSIEKPVGTVWVGYCINDAVHSQLLQLSGNREEIRTQAVLGAVAGVLSLLNAPHEL